MLTLYVYRPRTLPAIGPAMLYTQGGGMIVSSARGYHEAASAYARDLGILVVSTEFRLAPEHPFPAPLDDIHAAYRWMNANAAALAIDPVRITVAGDRAGFSVVDLYHAR